MREGFEHYYRLSKHDIAKLWRECVFVFDANVLLDLYRYTPETKDELFSTLDKLKARIWIPHQVALEFHRNRLDAVAATFQPYQQIKDVIAKLRKDALAILSQLSSKHPFIKPEEIGQKIDLALKEIGQELDRLAAQHPNQSKRADEDDIRDHLSKLFENKTGAPLENEELAAALKEGEQRYAKKIPPGYMDEKPKDAERRFGDLVIWKQVIKFAKENKQSVIFVTGDTKEDWWEIKGNSTIGPRPELRQEFYEETKELFYMYETTNFLKHAAKVVAEAGPVKDAAVKEIQAVQRERNLNQLLREAARIKQTEIAEFERVANALKASELELNTAHYRNVRDALSGQTDFEKLANSIKAFELELKKALYQSAREALSGQAEFEKMVNSLKTSELSLNTPAFRNLQEAISGLRDAEKVTRALSAPDPETHQSDVANPIAPKIKSVEEPSTEERKKKK